LQVFCSAEHSLNLKLLVGYSIAVILCAYIANSFEDLWVIANLKGAINRFLLEFTSLSAFCVTLKHNKYNFREIIKQTLQRKLTLRNNCFYHTLVMIDCKFSSLFFGHAVVTRLHMTSYELQNELVMLISLFSQDIMDYWVCGA